MAAIRPERLELDRVGQDGPEAYAPHRNNSDRLNEISDPATTAFEGEIREFVRRDIPFLRRPLQEADAESGPASENLNSLIRRISNASMEEIDRVVVELQNVREMLRHEGERIGREIGGYASLSHAALTTMKVISESLQQWRNPPSDDDQRQTY
jgi:hypothetical protein